MLDAVPVSAHDPSPRCRNETLKGGVADRQSHTGQRRVKLDGGAPAKRWGGYPTALTSGAGAAVSRPLK